VIRQPENMPDQPHDDLLLVQRATEGDQVAVQTLFLRHYQAIKSHIQFQIPQDLGGPINIDDIVQQAFSKAYRSLSAFQSKSPGGFLAWLRTIATNQLRDELRRHQREKSKRAHRPPGSDESEATYRILLERIGAAGEDGPQHAMKDELLRALRTALAILPEDYRSAIRLRYMEGLTMAEVARSLGKTEAAARAVCTRALAMLRDELERLSRFI
jgi:RNA polymerase sigma-70 factor (ECF subfamily)